jgi:hypothetical protein
MAQGHDMKQTREKNATAFKAKVALAAIRGRSYGRRIGEHVWVHLSQPPASWKLSPICLARAPPTKIRPRLLRDAASIFRLLERLGVRLGGRFRFGCSARRKWLRRVGRIVQHLHADPERMHGGS